ncbi:MAG: hypothetical protein KDB01_02665 [Planctomycetaceae bacterium]|nr:hypothetical protein [Planctomycetaceae bacterium]
MKSTTTAEFWAEDAKSIAERDRLRVHGEHVSVTHNAKPFTDLEDAAKAKQFWLRFAAAAIAVCLFVAWILSPRTGAGRQGSEPQLATADERNKIHSIAQTAVNTGVLLRIESNGERADVYVLEPFKQATIDEKNFIIRIAYLDAFGLAPNATNDSRAMAVIDGTTGERLKTVDMNLIGLSW